MNKSVLFDFVVDKENKKINVARSFHAPLDLVWAAWTDAEILDQWWAPKPWLAETKSMNFAEGGTWHYCMVSPEDEKHWCLFDYEKIVHENEFSGRDAFCDQQGQLNTNMPRTHWKNVFNEQDDATVVQIQISFNALSDLETIIDMGFKEGFTMGLQNLDAYIKAQFYLRKQKKPDNAARVSTYLNFPGNTEEAFEFYQSVFKTQYVKGIQRFGDLPADPAQTPLSEALKKMVLHVELPLMANHILMGTDAPAEMGFEVVKGNNMHINLEPDSKEETDRIFNRLADGGAVTMPLQDMFWGAYYGSVTDKFGINRMLNFQTVK